VTLPTALALLSCFVLAPAPALEAQAKSESVVLQLNGRTLGEGRLLRTVAGERVFVLVATLASVIDGRSQVDSTATGSTRLRLEGRSLVAVAAGGCEHCPVLVARPVVISSHVQTVDGALAFPLSDLVAAFEARLAIDSTRAIYGIHAGTCTWCILRPR